VVDTAVGAALTTYLQNDRVLMFAAIGLVVGAHCVVYRQAIDERLRPWLRTLRGRFTRRQPDPVPDHPDRIRAAARFVALLAAAVAVTAAAFFAGYWLLGAGFAHGWLAGLAGLAGFVAVAALLAAWWRYRPARPGRTRSWPGLGSGRGTAIGSVVILGQSAGATLGASDLRPAPAAAAGCPSPTELRVLASSEVLAPLQSAIHAFEQDERAVFRSPCYTVDITAYAAADDKAADAGMTGAWSLADGPRPDIWIPDSSEEAGRAGKGNRGLSPLRSIGSTPLVIAVPTARGAALAAAGPTATLGQLYQAASTGLTFQLPNVRLSEAGRLGIAGLYRSLTPAERTRIGATGSFPTDSASLLCQAASAADPAPAAYLVSSLAVRASNDAALGAAACPGQQAGPGWLSTFRPAGGTVLDFPFATVSWPGVPVSAAKATAERAFYDWLTGDGVSVLREAGLEPPVADPALPPSGTISSAVSGLTRTQPSARILLAVDDSAPMQPYLGQIGQAVSAVLGPQAQGSNLSARDSFAVWTFPGRDGQGTDRALVPLAPVTPAQRAKVPKAVAGLSGKGHSAQFDLVYDAALSLATRAPRQSASSVVLLTDGDISPVDAHGTNMVKTITTLDQLRVKVYVIAFGPAGCGETPSGLFYDSLTWLAQAGGGTCVNAASGGLAQQLAQDISTLSTGGG
jgi:hypothetical protein